MSQFRYKAYDGTGSEASGTLDAARLQDAIQKLKNDGLYPKEVTELLPGASGRVSVTAQELAMTTRQLGTLLKAGASLTEALDVVARERGSARLGAVMLRVNEAVSQGSSLAGALETYPSIFPGVYRGMVAAGEASGSLDEVLARLADYLETRARIARDVRAALIYPLFMIIAGCGVLSFLFIFVIPKIMVVFEDSSATMPFITIVLLSIAHLLRTIWPLLLLVTVLSIFGIRFALRRPDGKGALDRWSLKVPVVGRLIAHFSIANLTRTLGTLLQGGLPILRSLEITKGAMDNTVFKGVVERAIKGVTEGAPLSASIEREEVAPRIVSHMITIGERGGNLGEMLLKASETYEQEFENGVKRALTLLEPLLILLMGVVVGFIVLAILLPIFELNQIVG
ncbi:MAG: type II secretion system F family protein [Thermodesulfobacteriota bacterium]